MTQDRRFHVRFRDPGTGEELGLVLQEPSALAYNRRLVNPFAAKAGEGDSTYRDLTEWTVWTQDNWHAGLGYPDYLDHDSGFLEAHGLDTRFEDQVILGPAPQYPKQDDAEYLENLPSHRRTRRWGWPSQEINADVSETGSGVNDAFWFCQTLAPQWQYLLGVQGMAHIDKIKLYLSKTADVAAGDRIICAVYDLDSDGDPDTELGSKELTGADIAAVDTWEWIEFEFATPVDVSDDEEYAIVLKAPDCSCMTNAIVYWGKTRDYSPYNRGIIRSGETAIYKVSSGEWGNWQERDYCWQVVFEKISVAQSLTMPNPGAPTVNNVAVWAPYRFFNPVKLELCEDSGGDPDTVRKTCVLNPAHRVLLVGSGSTTTTIEVNNTDGYDTSYLYQYQWVKINGEERQVASITDANTFVLASALSDAPTAGDKVYNAGEDGNNSNNFGPRIFRFDTGYATTNGNTYHIVLTPLTDNHTLYSNQYPIAMDRYAGYAHGSVQYRVGTGAWTAWPYTEDMMFRLNVYSLEDDVVAFKVFNDHLYCAAGDTVYEWDESAQQWVSSRQSAGNDVTGLEAWGGYLWAAWGNAANCYRYNGAAWSDTSEKFTLLYGAQGYLHASGAGANAHKVYYYDDPAGSATAGWECGPSSDYPVTGLAWLQDYLVASTEQALWACYTEGYPYVITSWKGQESEYNGKGMVSWARDNAVYIPLRYGLYRFDGDAMTPVGPELRNKGLPDDQTGTFVQLLPMTNFLYAVVDGGGDHYSSVLAYDGMSAWHEVWKSPDSDKRIRAIGWSALQEPDRVWIGHGDSTLYFLLPDKTDNPHNWNVTSGSELDFSTHGQMITGWIGRDLIETVKDLHEVVILAENLDEHNTIRIAYQLDRAKRMSGEDLWVSLGEVDYGRRNSLKFGVATWGSKRIATVTSVQELIMNADDSVDDIEPGDCAVINGQAVLIRGVDSSTNTIYLNVPLEETPTVGDEVKPTYPTAREFRLRIELETDNLGEPTPVLNALVVRYQVNVLDRWAFDLQVEVGRGGELVNGLGQYALDPLSLRSELDEWAGRPAPFELLDPDGRTFTVKVTRAAETGYNRDAAAGQDVYDSTYHFTLMEVE